MSPPKSAAALFPQYRAHTAAGVEANLRYERAHWRIAASYAFLDATFRTPLTLSSPANPTAADVCTIAVEPGDRLPALRGIAARFRFDYTPHGWSLGGDLVARSGQRLVGTRATTLRRWRVHSSPMRGRDVALADGLRLLVEVRNVYDRGYASSAPFSDIGEVAIAEGCRRRRSARHRQGDAAPLVRVAGGDALACRPDRGGDDLVRGMVEEMIVRARQRERRDAERDCQDRRLIRRRTVVAS